MGWSPQDGAPSRWVRILGGPSARRPSCCTARSVSCASTCTSPGRNPLTQACTCTACGPGRAAPGCGRCRSGSSAYRPPSREPANSTVRRGGAGSARRSRSDSRDAAPHNGLHFAEAEETPPARARPRIADLFELVESESVRSARSGRSGQCGSSAQFRPGPESDRRRAAPHCPCGRAREPRAPAARGLRCEGSARAGLR